MCIRASEGADGTTPATSGLPVQQPSQQPKPGSWPGKHVWPREKAERGTVENLLLTPSEAAKALSISRSKEQPRSSGPAEQGDPRPRQGTLERWQFTPHMERLLTVTDVCEVLSISRATVYL